MKFIQIFAVEREEEQEKYINFCSILSSVKKEEYKQIIKSPAYNIITMNEDFWNKFERQK